MRMYSCLLGNTFWEDVLQHGKVCTAGPPHTVPQGDQMTTETVALPHSGTLTGSHVLSTAEAMTHHNTPSSDQGKSWELQM